MCYPMMRSCSTDLLSSKVLGQQTKVSLEFIALNEVPLPVVVFYILSTQSQSQKEKEKIRNKVITLNFNKLSVFRQLLPTVLLLLLVEMHQSCCDFCKYQMQNN